MGYNRCMTAYKKEFVQLPNHISRSTRSSLWSIAQTWNSAYLMVEPNGSNGYRDGATAHLINSGKKKLIEVKLNPLLDTKGELSVDTEKVRFVRGGGDGLATFAIAQTVLTTMIDVIDAWGIGDTAKLILDDANYGYEWSRLFELFEPESEMLSVDFGGGTVYDFTYHLYRK
jgi:hypothetical protein